MKCPICQTESGLMATKVRDGSVDIFYCNNCALAFIGDNLTELDLKTYYDEEYRKTTSPKLGHSMKPEETFAAELPFQDNRLSLLKEYFSKNKSLLDVGCSSGMFLWHAKDHLGEVSGIDYDSRSALFAGQRCQCRTYTGEIEDTDLQPESFDIICAFQVLEHTFNPVSFINRHAKYLKQGGIFAVEVPNLNDALLQAYDVPYYREFYFHKSHRWYFTANGLKNIMARCGFSGDVFFIQNYNILNLMNWIFRNAPQADHFSGRMMPELPIVKSADDGIKKDLNLFIKKADEDYKNRLADLGMTDIFIYIGKKI